MMEEKQQYRAYGMILLTGILWGTIGIYVDALRQSGFSSLQIVTLRAITTVFWMSLYILLTKGRIKKLPVRLLPYVFGTGVLSIALFNWAYFQAIHLITLSVAAALLYTGPAFVVVLARIFFKEPFTREKQIAVVLTTFGAALASGVSSNELVQILSHTNIISNPTLIFGNVTIVGLLIGLLSGFSFALYSIFAKPLTSYIPAEEIVFYTFLMTALTLIPFSGIINKINLIFNTKVILWMLAFGLLPTALAFILYTSGLKIIGAGRAAMLATVEPVVAVLLGVFLFANSLTLSQILGIVLILIAVIILSERKHVKF